MKLYYKPGACSLAARIVLSEAGAAFEDERVDTVAGLTAAGASYRTINPRGYVPALDLGNGTILTENAAVLPYLAATHAPDLLPASEPLGEARLHEAMSFLSSELHKAFGPFFAASGTTVRDRLPDRRHLARRLDDTAGLLGENAYLVGGRYGVADIYAFVLLGWTPAAGLFLADWPRLAAFRARIGTRPAVVSALRAEGLPVAA